jgi:phosphatidylinositol 4-kinase
LGITWPVALVLESIYLLLFCFPAALADTLEALISSIVSALSGNAKEFYEKEFSFFDKVTSISGEIRKFPKGPERKKACLDELAKIEVEQGCYLPSNPEALVIDIDPKSGTPMQRLVTRYFQKCV